MKMGTSQSPPLRWTNENLFDMCSSLFKMLDSKKQKSTKLPQKFCLSACGKEIPRLFGLGNLCTFTSCHSATMPFSAMHLIGRCMLWQLMCPQNPCPKKLRLERYGSLPKTSNTLNIRTLKIIAKDNFEMVPKISNSD